MNTGMSTTPVDRPGAPASLSQRKALALRRLDTSRTHLIVCLLPDEPKRHASAPTGTSPTLPDLSRLVGGLKKRIERNGLANGAWRTARAWGRRWWKRQPWHAPAELVVGTLAHEGRPIVRRHPWAVLAAGAALGAAVVAARPWFAHTLRQRAWPMRHQMGSLLWTQLAQAPVQIAIAGALASWITDLSKPRHPAPETPPAEHAPEPPTHHPGMR
jgi:hypothetical protein